MSILLQFHLAVVMLAMLPKEPGEVVLKNIAYVKEFVDRAQRDCQGSGLKKTANFRIIHCMKPTRPSPPRPAPLWPR